MECCRGYDGSHLLKNERIPCTSSEVLDPLWTTNSTPFNGTASMVNFEDVGENNHSDKRLFSHIDCKVEENCDEEFGGSFHQPEKKRRLLPEQVKFLEKSFEVENKLEPDRKIQLAKELGLQPRQIAIWFQNRRARYKTKLLEKEYDSLKSSYDKLKADYDTLFSDNEKLKNEVHLLAEKLLLKENGKPKTEPKNPIFSTEPAKSDVFDSESPHCTDGNQSAANEPTGSSHVFEPEPSDFSQDEDESLSRNLLHPSCFPKIEVDCYDDDLQPNSCNLGFPVQDQGTWFWQY